jgi:hypothetical protein
MASGLPPLGFGMDAERMVNDLAVENLWRQVYPHGVPQYPQQPSPNMRIGRFSVPGEGLDQAALSILQALQSARRPRNFGEGLIQGVIGGFAGTRARGAAQRQQFNEQQQRRQVMAENEAIATRRQAAMTLAQRPWELAKQRARELDDTELLTPEMHARLKAQNVFIDESQIGKRIPRQLLYRDMPVRAERDPYLAALTKMQIDEKIAKQQADEDAFQSTVEEVASFRQSPSSVLKGARGGDAVKYRNRLIAEVNKRLRESGSSLDFAKLEALEKERDNFYKTQNNQRFTALRQASATVAKHLKQLEDFYDKYRKVFEEHRKKSGVFNPGELRVLNAGMLAAAENGMFGPEAAEEAAALRATSGAVSREAALVFSSGFAPLDQDIAEARHNISAAIGPRGHKGQVKALRALLKARINTAIQGTPFAGGKKNPYLLEVSPLEGWNEGEGEAVGGPPSGPIDSDAERRRLYEKYK